MSASNTNDRQTSELYVLTEVAKALTTSLALPALLEAVMERIAEVLAPAEFGVVLLWDPSTGLFRPQAVYGPTFPNLQALRQLSLQEGESVTGKVHTRGETIVLSNEMAIAEFMGDLRPANRAAWNQALDVDMLPRSILAGPLWAGGHKFGVLILGTIQRKKVFSANDIPFVQTLADLIALAIDRARLEAEALATLEAKQADRLRAEALATLSHELRTPLGAIKGYSTALLLEEISWSTEKRHEFLQLIEEECENLETMIGNILDSSLIDVGQLTLEYQPVRLERLAREVAAEMQRRSNLHSIVLDFPKKFPIIDADPLRLKQVFRNIVYNALKYSPEGGLVMIRGQIRPTDVVISIADQGVGISPEDLIPLFEKYFRVKAPAGHHVPGTGLGLPVARTIVEAHQGRIWAESKIGTGTTLYFSLPRQGLSSDLEHEHE
ncbi:MAG: GAF domain-containing protein [Anaerolineae bacterium]|nr:GAF domain-containing protein [Anaerolineae bacterium]